MTQEPNQEPETEPAKTLDLPGAFHGLASMSIADLEPGENVHPYQAIARGKDDGITMAALALSPKESIQWFWSQVASGEFAEIIFGLDRFAKPGQGCEFDEVHTVTYYKDGKIFIGCIEYQREPLIIKPIDWDNEHFFDAIQREHLSLCPIAPYDAPVFTKGKP